MSKKSGQTQQSYCPYCHVAVAPGDREVIEVIHNGQRTKAHLTHAILHFVDKIGCDPTAISEPWQFKNFLIDQANVLFNGPFTDEEEKKFQTLLQIHEELYGQPLQISTLTASA